MTVQTAADTGDGGGDAGEVECWCCEWTGPEPGVIRLGTTGRVLREAGKPGEGPLRWSAR